MRLPASARLRRLVSMRSGLLLLRTLLPALVLVAVVMHAPWRASRPRAAAVEHARRECAACAA